MAATNQRRSSDHDKPLVLDNTYIEFMIFTIMKMDILNFIKVKAVLAKEFHIQPSEIDNMPVWEYEIFMKAINDIVKEENERNKREMDKSGYNEARSMSNPSNISKMQQAAMPKMPNININAGNMKTPKF